MYDKSVNSQHRGVLCNVTMHHILLHDLQTWRQLETTILMLRS